MTFEEKISHFRQDLISRGKKLRYGIPPIYPLLWKLGIRVRPPVFLTVSQSILMHSVYFGGLFGFLKWFMSWRKKRIFSRGSSRCRHSCHRLRCCPGRKPRDAKANTLAWHLGDIPESAEKLSSNHYNQLYVHQTRSAI